METAINCLTQAIIKAPRDKNLYLQRGKLYMQTGDFGNAINDFVYVQDLDPDNTEANQYIEMLSDILEFHNSDIYNP